MGRWRMGRVRSGAAENENCWGKTGWKPRAEKRARARGVAASEPRTKNAGEQWGSDAPVLLKRGAGGGLGAARRVSASGGRADAVTGGEVWLSRRQQ
ncbi:UNVERIFIED_CONTAM: hypothetical protein Slati_1179200 [Sesamum latifolium]|uniref:Uncharacterized protein n=1 Tax=Sesamum latifolium TaxID=2727402 RepID=A0AAW2XGJ2_9LAMI